MAKDAAPDATTGDDRVSGCAVAPKAVLPEAPAGFAPPERAPCSSEWLDKLIYDRADTPSGTLEDAGRPPLAGSGL